MKRSLRLLPALTLLLCLLSACGAGLRTAESPSPAVTAAAASAAPAPTPEPTAPPTPAPTPTPTPTPPPVTLGETEDMGQDYLDAIVFYGDSNTNGLRLLELLPGGYGTDQIWTPMSGTLTLSRWNIDKIVYPETWTEMDVTAAMALKKPAYLIVNLGMNGISFMDRDYFIETYTAMAEALHAASPDTKIMLSSIYPVAKSYPYQKDINNDKITQANGWIRDIAEAEGLRYLDTAAALRDENGDLPENLQDGNGFHLTAEGYGLVLDYIRTHGYR